MPTERNRPLERLFNAITIRYDRMNRILTLGMDRRWRRIAAREVGQAVESAAERSPGGAEGANAGDKSAAVLDLCTGTGDLAYILAKRIGGNASIIGLDYSPHMLERAEEKRNGDPDNPRFMLGDAAALPWDAPAFDAVVISFAFRNLTYNNPRMTKTLAEIRRVLRSNGKLIVVESSQPRLKVVRFFRDIYVEIMVGKLVAWLTGHRSEYRYLADSVKRYYTPPEIREILTSAGFHSMRYKPLFFGAAGVYVAQ